MNGQYPQNQEQLHQQLLELHYGLLDDEEARELRAAIETSPEVAAAWASTLKMAGQFADAAKLQGVKTDVEITSPAVQPDIAGEAMTERSAIQAAAATGQVAAAGGTTATDPTKQRSSGRWVFRALFATAASIGLLFVGVRFLDRLPTEPAMALRLKAEAIDSDENARGNQIQITTSALDQTRSRGGAASFRVIPASLSLSILAKGAKLYEAEATTDKNGSLQFNVPSGMIVPEGAILNVTAYGGSRSSARSTITIPLEPTRCLTHLSIDKPVYRPGETVWFRSLTLERVSMRPDLDLPIQYTIKDPSGALVPGSTIDGVTDRGVGNGSFRIPESAVGGEYTLTAHSLDGFFPDEQRALQVRVYRTPRFKKQIEFKKRSYGQGDEVQADYVVVRAEGGPIVGAPLRVAATVDGEMIYQGSGVTDEGGAFTVNFTLPDLISKGEGQLSIMIDDGGTQETQSKTIPIQLGRVATDFYPEGGYLVAGLKNRVYFAARDTLGKPIHVAGEVLSEDGDLMAEIETTRDGMGRFEFTPTLGQRYVFKVTSPLDTTNSPELPPVVSDLPVLDTGKGVFAEGEDLGMTVRSLTNRSLLVQAVCRGRLLTHETTSVGAGSTKISVRVPGHVGGVVRITLLDPSTTPAKPLVERLVYCRKENGLTVRIAESPSDLQRAPGDSTRVTLEVLDRQGQPTPAVLGVGVVDDAALSLDTVERPSLRTHFLLTSEVDRPEDLEHANFYLAEGDDAARSLDLLLGTQGWRRFATGGGPAVNEDFREQIARLIQLNGRVTEPSTADNGDVIGHQWRAYMGMVTAAWGRMWMELRIMIIPLLFVWLLAFLVRPRAGAAVNACLLAMALGYVSLFIGCGAEPMSRSEQSDVVAASENEFMAGADDGADWLREAATPAPNLSSVEASDPTVPDDKYVPPTGKAAKEMGDRADALLFGNVADGFEDSRLGSSGGPGMPSGGGLISADQLQQLLRSRGIDPKGLGKQLLDELRFPVRQYAHQHSDKGEGVREDFTETLLWQPLLITDSSGRASVKFELSDSITTFRVLADAHTSDGRLGSGGGEVISRVPLQIEPKMPLEVTTGDRIDLPVAVINTTSKRLPVDLQIRTDSALKPLGDTEVSLKLEKQDRDRHYFSVDVVAGSSEVDATIELRGASDKRSLVDVVRRTLHIAPQGYPVRESFAGTLDERTSMTLPIPESIVPGSLAVTVRAYPSPLADLLVGVESILREPHGCFEQTSATNYPNAMALQYLKESKLSNPEITDRAMKLLNKGYGKLTSFECQRRGYEWFGTDPGHEALSAFGLMQFTDMGELMQVDTQMMVRTRRWLMDRRTGQGGFQRNPRHLHVWSVDQTIVDAYVLWALTEADVRSGNQQKSAVELSRELDQLMSISGNSNDPYLIALASASLMNVGRTDAGIALLEKLKELQSDNGMLDGKTTVTQSGGISKQVETTALGVLAFAKSPRQFSAPLRKAAQWIVKNRQGHGGFGSTQATVLALKALVTYTRLSQAGGQGAKNLRIIKNDEVLASAPLPSNPSSSSSIEITGLGGSLGVGESVIQLEAAGAKNLPFSVEVFYHTVTPPTAPECPLSLTTELKGELDDEEYVVAGDTLQVEAVLTNTSAGGLPMTVATIGLPGGLEPRAEQLNEMREQGVFDFYELRPREVICYWRTIHPESVTKVTFDVTATVPGKYTGPASRAYLYYTAEQKHWVEPLEIKIAK